MSDYNKKFLAIIIGLLLLVVFSSGCLDQGKEDKAIHDSDGDGYEDEIDVFPDDANEWIDTDRDGVGNNNDTDDDNDGMPDEWELKYGFDPVNNKDADSDFDNDNYTNIEEYQDKTDPLNSTDNYDTSREPDINETLPDPNIFEFYPDTKPIQIIVSPDRDQAFLATYCGLIVINLETKNFTRYSKEDGLDSAKILGIASDRSCSRVFAISSNGTIYEFQTSSGKLKNYCTGFKINDKIGHFSNPNHFPLVFNENDDKLIYPTLNGLVHIDLKKDQSNVISWHNLSLNNNDCFITAMISNYNNSELYLAVYPHKLLKYSYKSQTTTVILDLETRRNNNCQGTRTSYPYIPKINSLALDEQANDIYIGTEQNGLLRIHSDGQVESLILNNADQMFPKVSQIEINVENQKIYILTDKEIEVHKLPNFELDYISKYEPNRDSGAFADIESNFALISNTEKILASWTWLDTGPGIVLYDLINSTSEYISTSDGILISTTNRGFLDEGINKFIGVGSKGVTIFNLNNYKIKSFNVTEVFNLPPGADAGCTYGAAYDSIRKKVYIGSYHGVAEFDVITEKGRIYNSINSLLPDNTIGSMACDPEGGILMIGTWIKGLAMVNLNNNSWTVFNVSNSQDTSLPLPSNSVLSLAWIEEKELFAIGLQHSDPPLILFSPETEEYIPIYLGSEFAGIPQHFIYNNKTNRLYFDTGWGIKYYDFSNDEIREIPENETVIRISKIFNNKILLICGQYEYEYFIYDPITENIEAVKEYVDISTYTGIVDASKNWRYNYGLGIVLTKL